VARVEGPGERFTAGGEHSTEEGPAFPMGEGETEQRSRREGLNVKPSELVLPAIPCSAFAAATFTFNTTLSPTERLITTGVGV